MVNIERFINLMVINRIMKRIAITGAKGTIGTILRKNLKEYVLTSIDLPEVDVRDYNKLIKALSGHDIVIHLAWDSITEDNDKDSFNPDNPLMFFNVYKAALEIGIPRVIMASSVHIDMYHKWAEPGVMAIERTHLPDSPYGADKLFMEAMGRYYAQKGLEVICLRFGGVNLGDRIDLEEDYEKVWLSQRDCVELVKTCIEAQEIPNNFIAMYGISNVSKKVYDHSNPLGWTPKDDDSKANKT